MFKYDKTMVKYNKHFKYKIDKLLIKHCMMIKFRFLTFSLDKSPFMFKYFFYNPERKRIRRDNLKYLVGIFVACCGMLMIVLYIYVYTYDVSFIILYSYFSP